jgi:replicative DNA helicase
MSSPPTDPPSLSEMPFSLESERAALSCILQDPEMLLDEARHQLQHSAFYHTQSALIYEVICEMSDKRLPLDLITLTNYARDTNRLEAMGGAAGLSEIYTFAPLDSHFTYYLTDLKAKLVQRNVIAACAAAIQSMRLCSADQVGEQLDRFQGVALGINMERDERGPEHISVAAQNVLTQTDAAIEAIKSGRPITGAPLGVSPDIDRILNGLERADRLAICAHPSTGKTSLMMNAARHFAEQGIPVLVFCLDDISVSIARRTIADMADVDITEIRSGIGLMHEEGHRKQRRMQDAQGLTRKLPIWLDDRSGLSIQQIAATTRRWFKKHARTPATSIDVSAVIMADYWQNITCHIKGDESNDVKRLTATSLAWKHLINSLQTAAGVLLSQLNRDVKEKGRPTPHNTKGSGGLYEDSTKMILLSNEYRTFEEVMAEEEEISEQDRNAAVPLRLGERLVVADIAKNKDGPTKPVWVRLYGSRTRFSGLVPGKKIYAATYNKAGRELEKQNTSQ